MNVQAINGERIYVRILATWLNGKWYKARISLVPYTFKIKVINLRFQ